MVKRDVIIPLMKEIYKLQWPGLGGKVWQAGRPVLPSSYMSFLCDDSLAEVAKILYLREPCVCMPCQRTPV